jgi:hypothetical protein
MDRGLVQGHYRNTLRRHQFGEQIAIIPTRAPILQKLGFDNVGHGSLKRQRIQNSGGAIRGVQIDHNAGVQDQ